MERFYITKGKFQSFHRDLLKANKKNCIQFHAFRNNNQVIPTESNRNIPVIGQEGKECKSGGSAPKVIQVPLYPAATSQTNATSNVKSGGGGQTTTTAAGPTTGAAAAGNENANGTTAGGGGGPSAPPAEGAGVGGGDHLVIGGGKENKDGEARQAP